MSFNYDEYRLQEINNTLQLYQNKGLTQQEKDLIAHLQHEREQILKKVTTDYTD